MFGCGEEARLGRGSFSSASETGYLNFVLGATFEAPQCVGDDLWTHCDVYSQRDNGANVIFELGFFFLSLGKIVNIFYLFFLFECFCSIIYGLCHPLLILLLLYLPAN